MAQVPNEQLSELITATTGLTQTVEGQVAGVNAATQANTDGANAAIQSLNDARTAFDGDAAAIATTKTQADNNAASITATKTTVDGQAADIATAINDINNAITPKLPMLNLLPDGGRFAGTSDANLSVTRTAAFDMGSSLFSPYNGSTFAEAGKFIHNNSTNGGSGGALAQTVSDLIAKQGRSGNSNRYGPEFYVTEITAGAGTGSSPRQGHYLMGTVTSGGILNQSSIVSYAAWLRLTAGTAWVYNQNSSLHVDGASIGAADHEMQVADGWIHVAGTYADNYGYCTVYLPAIYGLAGTKVEIAIPTLVPANLTIAPYKQPLFAN